MEAPAQSSRISLTLKFAPMLGAGSHLAQLVPERFGSIAFAALVPTAIGDDPPVLHIAESAALATAAAEQARRIVPLPSLRL